MTLPRTSLVALIVMPFLFLAACSGMSAEALSPSGDGDVDADAIALIDLAEQATLLARAEAADAILLQVDTNLDRTWFRFMDGAKTIEIFVLHSSAETSPNQWSVRIDPISRPGPGITLERLLVGPGRVADAIVAEWPDCASPSMTLFGDGDRLIWSVGCNTPDGVVTGEFDNETGRLLLKGGPARPPATATP
jgi:hypothetical protein